MNPQFFSEYGICEECAQPKTGILWCNACNADRFRKEFDKWTSGNKEIDLFIQNSQLKARCTDEIIEWLPFEKFKDVEHIAKGGFGSVFKAAWIDGYIDYWNDKTNEWSRYNKGLTVCLKSLHNSANFISEFLEEIENHIKLRKIVNTITIYGITKDPNGDDYMMVMDYAEEGSLRHMLNKKSHKLTWKDKLLILKTIIFGLDEVHRVGLMHKDFHSGNIVMGSMTCAYITDFGLCKPMNEIRNTEHKKLFGVLAYVAPEVLKGKEYTRASDVYSFGIIMYEVLTGCPPYHDVPHDEVLALKICRGQRPKIRCKVPQLFLDLMNRCLDAIPENRPTTNDMNDIIYRYWVDLFESDDESEISRQCKEIQKLNVSQIAHTTHVGSVYTSQLLNFKDLPEPVNSASGTTEMKQFQLRIQELEIEDDDDDKQ